MISKIRIKNFKCIQDTGDIKIKPITILVGPNSSGKSSIIKMLLMLRQTNLSADIYNPLITNGELVECGSYPDFIYKGDVERNLEVSIDFCVKPLKMKKELQNKIISLRSEFGYNPRTTQIRIKECEIKSGSSLQRIFLNESKRSYSLELIHYDKDEENKILFAPIKPQKFFDFSGTRKLTKKEGDQLTNFLKPTDIYVFRYYIDNAFKNIFYLGPIRDTPKRIYAPTGETPEDVGIRGEKTVDVLWLCHNSSNTRLKNIETSVKQWVKEFEFSNSIRFERLSKGTSLFKKGTSYYRVELSNLYTDYDADLTDVGFGVSQLLPIIVESYYAPSDGLVMIEQPEIHLHPKAQAILADLFIDAILHEKKQFIIETHSEHLLDRLRRRIAEKKLKKEDISIYYFEPSKDGTLISEITLNDLGQYIDFPDGFFEEDLDESYEHIKAIEKNFVKL